MAAHDISSQRTELHEIVGRISEDIVLKAHNHNHNVSEEHVCMFVPSSNKKAYILLKANDDDNTNAGIKKPLRIKSTNQNSPKRNRSIYCTPASSTSSRLVSESVIHNEFTHKLNLFSCLFFLFGGFFYTLLSILDIIDIKRYQDVDDDDGDDAFYLDVNDNISIPMYSVVYATAAMSYLINAFIDIVLVSAYNNKSSYRGVPDDILILSSSPKLKNSSLASTFESTIKRKKLNFNKLSSYFFAVAALLDLIAAFTYSVYPYQSGIFSGVACPLYMFEAIFALYGRARESSDDDSTCSSDILTYESKMVYFLDTTGDVLFLVGALIDVVIGYYYLIPRYENSLSLCYCGLGSSVLWLVDGLLYIAAEQIYVLYQPQGKSSTGTLEGEWESLVNGKPGGEFNLII